MSRAAEPEFIDVASPSYRGGFVRSKRRVIAIAGVWALHEPEPGIEGPGLRVSHIPTGGGVCGVHPTKTAKALFAYLVEHAPNWAPKARFGRWPSKRTMAVLRAVLEQDPRFAKLLPGGVAGTAP